MNPPSIAVSAANRAQAAKEPGVSMEPDLRANAFLIRGRHGDGSECVLLVRDRTKERRLLGFGTLIPVTVSNDLYEWIGRGSREIVRYGNSEIFYRYPENDALQTEVFELIGLVKLVHAPLGLDERSKLVIITRAA